METDFIYWRHITPLGIKVEEITGGEDKSPDTWMAMALQIYCENGRDGLYRSILHLPSGMPLLEGEETRISITHTKGLLAVASLPKTPEVDLAKFSLRTAMGIDAERADREQVMRIRDKFLSASEKELIGESLEKTIIAWTAKEAMYKAAMIPGLNWIQDIKIITLPIPGPPTLLKSSHPLPFGHGEISSAEGKKLTMELYTYYSEDFIITLACSPRCAKYNRDR